MVIRRFTQHLCWFVALTASVLANEGPGRGYTVYTIDFLTTEAPGPLGEQIAGSPSAKGTRHDRVTMSDETVVLVFNQRGQLAERITHSVAEHRTDVYLALKPYAIVVPRGGTPRHAAIEKPDSSSALIERFVTLAAKADGQHVSLSDRVAGVDCDATVVFVPSDERNPGLGGWVWLPKRGPLHDLGMVLGCAAFRVPGEHSQVLPPMLVLKMARSVRITHANVLPR